VKLCTSIFVINVAMWYIFCCVDSTATQWPDDVNDV